MKYPQPVSPRFCAAITGLLLSLMGASSCNKALSDYGSPVVKQASRMVNSGAIVVVNNSPGQVRITCNNNTGDYFVASGKKDTLYGIPAGKADILIETVTADKLGNPAGQQLVFQFADVFPDEGNMIMQEINIPPSLFFLSVINSSTVPADELRVADGNGSGGEIISAFSIENNKSATPCGYYPVSNLKASVKVSSKAGRQWNFTGLELGAGINQSVAVTCN
jgi:hypothetical protein